MEYCLAAAVLNALDRRSLQRSARLGREVLERAKRRAVKWHSPERSRGSVGVLYPQGPYQERWSVSDLQRLLGEREERCPTLSASFRTMAEFMDYASSQCGKYYSSMPEEGGQPMSTVTTEGSLQRCVCAQTQGTANSKETAEERHLLVQGSIYQTSERSQEAFWPIDNVSKDLYIEVYPGTYSVTVGSNSVTKKTHVVAVDPGQSVDLVFPI